MPRSNNAPGKKYQELLLHLESQIAAGIYSPGEKLPTYRQMATAFHLTQGTVMNGMQALQDKGLIELRHGSGAFVCAARKMAGNGCRIALVSASGEQSKSFFAHALLGLQQAATAYPVILEQHYGIDFLKLQPDELSRNLCAIAASCDALILVGAFDHTLRTLPLHCPAVGIDMRQTYGGLLSPVTRDPWQLAELTIDYFRKRGIRKIRCFSDGPASSQTSQLDLETIRQLWDGPFEHRQSWNSGAEPPGDPDTGYLFSDRNHLERAVAHWHPNAALPTLLSLDYRTAATAFATIYADQQEIGKAALEEAFRRINTPGTPSRRLYLTPRFSGDVSDTASTPTISQGVR